MGSDPPFTGNNFDTRTSVGSHKFIHIDLNIIRGGGWDGIS
ncbi:hypothetical protein SAMN05518684_11325 [Salipaludibacillus aurantiacus]|uniref:Uncharacterized protein n=1 Tax=Salipaludibacillus aurantiacus TaxID=1601833 RepID=A0A1H9VWX9_9BACI|nr:hypothetical protein SAMN05518684_11325 [Salipaludibacillus aurantiacus]